MKVLHVASSTDGGIGQVLRSLCSASGIDSVIATFQTTTRLDSGEFHGARLRFLPATRSKISAGLVHSLRMMVVEERPDVVHCHALKAGVWCTAARVDEIAPVLYTGHGIRHLQLTGIKEALAKVIEREVFHRADAVTFLSEGERTRAVKAGLLGDRPHWVVSNCIDVIEVSDALKTVISEEIKKGMNWPQRTILILNVGRLAEQKDPGFFVQVALQVPAMRDNLVRFAWIGDGPLLPLVSRWIARSEAAGRISLLGQVPRSSVLRWLIAADVFFVTSRYEGVPVALLEAMAAGCVVVAPAIPGITDLIVDGVTGLLYPPHRTDKAVEVLSRAILYPERFRVIREAARLKVLTEFSPARRMVDGYLAIYRALTQARRGGQC